MTPEHIDRALHRLRALVLLFPPGTVIYHRASGERQLVDGWLLAGDGQPMLSTTNGRTSGMHSFPFEFSTEPVPDPDAGEQWKTA